MWQSNADGLSCHLRLEHASFDFSLRFIESDSRLVCFERSQLRTNRMTDEERLLFFVCFGVRLACTLFEPQLAGDFVGRCGLDSAGEWQPVRFEVGGWSDDGVRSDGCDDRGVAGDFSSVSEGELGRLWPLWVEGRVVHWTRRFIILRPASEPLLRSELRRRWSEPPLEVCWVWLDLLERMLHLRCRQVLRGRSRSTSDGCPECCEQAPSARSTAVLCGT